MDFDEDPNYLDLDDILAHTQTVDCEFLVDVPGLDFLTSRDDDEDDVQQGKKSVLPFWMAKTLYTISMIDIKIPKHYNTNFQGIMGAEADVVDLHRAGPYYYHLGKLLMDLRREKGNDLAPFTEEGQRNKFRREEGETLVDRRSLTGSLLDTFHYRRHKILKYSTNQSEYDHNVVKSFQLRLDNMEKQLFRIGQQHREELKDWDSKRTETIRNNQIAARLSKRRRLEM
uniref:DNA replication complex GINS protein PSF3 n=1 Tax=Aceria tosichella TaxID=561515 RepID=A0A6G1SKK9_9ACAR